MAVKENSGMFAKNINLNIIIMGISASIGVAVAAGVVIYLYYQVLKGGEEISEKISEVAVDATIKGHEKLRSPFLK